MGSHHDRQYSHKTILPLALTRTPVRQVGFEMLIRPRRFDCVKLPLLVGYPGFAA